MRSEKAKKRFCRSLPPTSPTLPPFRECALRETAVKKQQRFETKERRREGKTGRHSTRGVDL
tara:strand:+ start:315 stop:500 length:186 start_codon:yes stop_codon:yes gene_type:complete